jgi:hypothetical protein
MAAWMPCGGGFIEADVIRWTESAYLEKRGRKKTRAINIGTRLVTAEVLRDADGWVHVLVRACVVLTQKSARVVPLLPKGEEARRKRTTIARGKCERLLWSDESARTVLLTSRFLARDSM